jgi:hypothetical protein
MLYQYKYYKNFYTFCVGDMKLRTETVLVDQSLLNIYVSISGLVRAVFSYFTLSKRMPTIARKLIGRNMEVVVAYYVALSRYSLQGLSKTTKKKNHTGYSDREQNFPPRSRTANLLVTISCQYI